MTSQFEAAAKTAEKEAKEVQSRLVFISHTHADRELALALKTLVETVYSGIVKTFVSSDPGPTGGIMPGEEWYSQIEANLRQAESVWVLATPTSITRPWIYWEAGTGRALCPRGVAVLRVGVTSVQVPSPLNNFQSYDGLTVQGVAELAGKVATQVGMNLAKVLVEDCAGKWLAIAQSHTPMEQSSDQVPELSPERLDRLDAAIARLESLAVTATGLRTVGLPRGPIADADADRLYVIGNYTFIYKNLAEFVASMDRAPSDSEFKVEFIDPDGDAMIYATRGSKSTVFFLASSELPSIEAADVMTERTSKLLLDLKALRDAPSG